MKEAEEDGERRRLCPARSENGDGALSLACLRSLKLARRRDESRDWLVDMVDTVEADRERAGCEPPFRLPSSSKSPCRLRPRSFSFLASSSSAMPFLVDVGVSFHPIRSEPHSVLRAEE